MKAVSSLPSMTSNSYKLPRSSSIPSHLSENIFTSSPPLSFGELVQDNKYTTKSLRHFIIKRFYKNLGK